MVCENCGSSLRIGKSLSGGKRSDPPEECPNCGADLSKQNRNGDRLEKGV